ncbi:MAG: TldD/PmbA family protein [Bacillota bacterium]
MQDLLNTATQSAEAAEIYCVNSETIPVLFEVNKLKNIETRRTNGAALRIIKSGKIGFSSSTDTGETAARELVSMAADSAVIGEPAKFDFPGPAARGGPTSAPRVYDDKIAKLSAGELVRMGQEIIDIITEDVPSIKCGVQLERKVEEVTIANSNNGGGSYSKTTLTALADALLVEGNDIFVVYAMGGSCHGDFDHRSLAQEIRERVRLGRNIATVSTGRMPVLFTPRGIMPLLIALQSALNGKTALDGASPLAGRIGQQVVDPRISIYDDPTLDDALGSCPMDGEGVQSRRTPLVEAGILRGFYYDLQTAGRAGESSTGNGFRRAIAGDHFESQPAPDTTNAQIAPGDDNLEEMIASMDEGIIVNQVMGAGQGNVLTGDFSINVHLGFKVEKGEIVGRVKDTMVAGNTLEVLNNIAAVSSRAEWAYGQYLAPAILFKSLGVAAKGR